MYEGWRDVLGYEGSYKINALGEVYSVKRRIILKTYLSEEGYYKLGLRGNGYSRQEYIHRLVAGAFHGPCPEGYLTRHLDGNKLNNHPANVIWGTPQENAEDNAKHGGQTRGEGHHKAKLTDAQVLEIYHSPKTQTQLAKEYGISQPSVSFIKRGINWPHLTQ